MFTAITKNSKNVTYEWAVELGYCACAACADEFKRQRERFHREEMALVAFTGTDLNGWYCEVCDAPAN